jgi:hypothetical protein
MLELRFHALDFIDAHLFWIGCSRQQRSSAFRCSGSMPQLYGDLVRGVIATLATPLYFCRALALQPFSMLRWSHLVICCTLASIGKFSLQSYWYRDRSACYIGFASSNMLTILICLCRWPNPHSRTLLHHFYMYLVITSANTALPFVEKMAMGFEAAVLTLFLSYISPNYSLEQIFPLVVSIVGTF